MDRTASPTGTRKSKSASFFRVLQSDGDDHRARESVLDGSSASLRMQEQRVKRDCDEENKGPENVPYSGGVCCTEWPVVSGSRVTYFLFRSLRSFDCLSERSLTLFAPHVLFNRRTISRRFTASSSSSPADDEIFADPNRDEGENFSIASLFSSSYVKTRSKRREGTSCVRKRVSYDGVEDF